MQAGLPFSFYSHLRSGKALNERNRMIITRGAYDLMDREKRDRFEPHGESSDGIQLPIDTSQG